MGEKMQKYKEKITNILQYIIVITIIFECNSIYSQIYGCHLVIRAVTIITSICCMLFLLIKNKAKINKKILPLIMYDYICSAIMLLNTSSLNGKIVVILMFIIYLPIVIIYLDNLSKKEIHDLLKKFVNVIIILCIISLVFWFFSSIVKILKPTNAIKVVWAKPYSIINSYLGLHFDTQEVWWITGSPLMRNTGIFVEGPMYAVVIMFALLANNLVESTEKNKRWKKNIILCITMISTMSITGIICAAIILSKNIIELFKNMNLKKKKIFISILVIVCVLALPVVTNLIIKKVNTSSALHRNLDLQIGIKIFFESPVIGKGINHERATELDYENGYGYSNTIIPVLTDGGIILFNIYLIPAVLFGYRSIKERKINYLILLIIYCIILFTTLIQYRMIMLMTIALMYVLSFNREFMEVEKSQ